MAGRFFSRKSKNGAGAPTEPDAVSPDTLYQSLVPALIEDEPPDAIPGIPNLYAVLGVDPRASDDIIRYAYRTKAARLHDANWRPGRAARQLAELNAAYEILGKPDRRADYDRQRARMYYYQETVRRERLLDETGVLSPGEDTTPLRRVVRSRLPRLGVPRGFLEAVAIFGVVAMALYAGYIVFGESKNYDLGPLQDAGAALGLPIRPRTVSTVAPTATAVAQPTPTPRPVIVPPVPGPSPTPDQAAAPAPVRGTAQVSNPNPPRGSEITVTARLIRADKPVAGAPVFLVAHYRTVNERFPVDDGTVQTNANGEAAITFNVGDATAGFAVNVDVTAQVDGETVQSQTSFTPR